ncbi:MAG TPA: acireductone synthase [Pyrinomonadaceae bacterium]|jgi:enolase-phosphatase E1|nr:acireductone synthase [Pyrinomonadaceae bacterium]
MPEADVRILLLDIEGTTTPIDFVYKVLFPYARRHVREFVEIHANDLLAEINGLKAEHRADNEHGNNPPVWRESSSDLLLDSIAEYFNWLMDLDRKSTSLKALQGKIWEAGYLSGRLRSEVYPDLPPAFARWRDQGRQIYIYSSGSVLAQKLLFAHTTNGDLSESISGYFDTTTGAKKASSSYQSIAANIGRPAREVLFISDVTGELDAARSAEMQTILCMRPGNAEAQSETHRAVDTFDVVLPNLQRKLLVCDE